MSKHLIGLHGLLQGQLYFSLSCMRMSKPQGHGEVGRIRQKKKDLLGTQTRDLPLAA
jgi:hypothetical protein